MYEIQWQNKEEIWETLISFRWRWLAFFVAYRKSSDLLSVSKWRILKDNKLVWYLERHDGVIEDKKMNEVCIFAGKIIFSY